jgi:hypothetical protein
MIVTYRSERTPRSPKPLPARERLEKTFTQWEAKEPTGNAEGPLVNSGAMAQPENAAVVITESDPTWETVSIPGICTFQIPPSVEIQGGTYRKAALAAASRKSNEQLQRFVLEIQSSPDRVVAQPRGINAFDSTALKRYCRIIVQTERGSKGDYAQLDEPLAVSVSELADLDQELKKQAQQEVAGLAAKGMKVRVLSWQPATIIRVNGIDAIVVTSTRSLNDAPSVLVRMYQIQNNDCLHTITVSYRESESNLWATDLNKVIRTFRFKKR